jgi:uncharacterized membrane protein
VAGGMHRLQRGAMPSVAAANIETIARIEEEFSDQRTFWQRVADPVAGFAGSLAFVVLHIVGLTAWFLINTGNIPGIHPFDPFPFVMLAMVVSCEAVILSTFVLMKQNRMSAKAERRDHLHLQVALLTEKELTKVLQLQRQIGERLGLSDLAHDEEVRELSEETAVDNLARELQRKLPTDVL